MDEIDPWTLGLLSSPEPSVAWRAHRLLAGLGDDDPAQRRRRELVAESDNVRRMLAHRRPDGTIRKGNETNAYRKWQGPHWTLAGLAELGYPPGDTSLGPLVDQVFAWLLAPRHLRPPSTAVLPGQGDRIRRCASQEGLALWYLHELGLADERTEILAARLIEWQWPDGGWNCDRNPTAHTSSVQETLLPLRGLARHHRSASTAPPAHLADAVDRAAEVLLRRRLLWRRHDGAPISPDWGHDPLRIQWPIRFYDVLFVLTVMAETGHIGDPRCADALALLESKRLPDGGYPAEIRTARTVDVVASGGIFADWGPTGHTRPNPYVSIDAAWVGIRSGQRDGTAITPLRRASASR
ncbi:hypothetical protein OG984_09140 [Nocardioides sp. NBC_00368]|uniref:hypothetical protein n=1 Tax=Nocardioides sp. NBC_00368 TaxID=2976000 RepID=UPI002E1AA454